MKIFYNAIRGFVLVSAALLISGCATFIVDVVASAFPTYQETTNDWPEINNGDGRIVIYYVRQGVLNTFSILGAGGVVLANISIDKQFETQVMDRTFVFADLTAGKHLIYIQAGQFKEGQTFEIEIPANKIIFLEIDIGRYSGDPPRIVSNEVAMKALVGIHSMSSEPMPFNVLLSQ